MEFRHFSEPMKSRKVRSLRAENYSPGGYWLREGLRAATVEEQKERLFLPDRRDGALAYGAKRAVPEPGPTPNPPPLANHMDAAGRAPLRTQRERTSRRPRAAA